MGGWIWKFLTDADFFLQIVGGLDLRETLSRWSNYVRGLVMALGLGIMSGAPPFDHLTQALGAAGWWGSGILMVLSVMIRSGDKTPPAAKALAAADPAQLQELLAKLGVPKHVADTAVEKTTGS